MLKRHIPYNQYEAGCDEAGRGCLAGPVTAAAIILPPDYSNPCLNDSKKMTERMRNELRIELEEVALSYSVAFIHNTKIDEINILRASILGMHHALDKLTITPHHILVDGNKFFPYKKIMHSCMIKGDSKYLSIAAASVLAKTYRDEYMEKLHNEFSQYGWLNNKGYPTKKHRKAIQEFGICKYHRRSFHLTETQMELSFYDNNK